MVAAHRQVGRVDTSSPLVLDTRELGRRPGSMRPVHRTADVRRRMGVDLVAVPAGGELELDLRMESVVEGVLVTGTADGVATGECSRCLEPLELDVTVHLTELYAYPTSTTEATSEHDEVRHVVDDHIDLTEALTDAVVLELPLRPLCGEECPGLCPDCGERLAVLEPGHRHETMDPRWAALAAKLEGPDAISDPTEPTHRSTDNGAAPDLEEK